mgnify:FL=1
MSNRGMSLVEVLTATAILSILLVPMLFMMMYSNRAVYRSSNDITATTLAISKMEELKSLPYFQLENLLLGLPASSQDRINRPDAARFVRGPFESYPEKPDISEPSIYKDGATLFHRYTYISYFPDKNPSSNDRNFENLRKRIKVHVFIYWKDKLSATTYIDQKLDFQAVIHDENFNPKPQFNRFTLENN